MGAAPTFPVWRRWATLGGLLLWAGAEAGRNEKHVPPWCSGVRQDCTGPRTLGLGGPTAITGTLRKWFRAARPQTVLVGISFGLWQALWLGLRIADTFGEHLAKLSLRLRGFPPEGTFALRLPSGAPKYPPCRMNLGTASRARSASGPPAAEPGTAEDPPVCVKLASLNQTPVSLSESS
jgi:hypothetical protein